MSSSKKYLVPGPILVPKNIKNIYQKDFGSADLDYDFIELYAETEKLWQTILFTKNKIVMMTGEAMLGLWGALKSSIQPGDKVLAIANGVFGDGIAEMAKAIGANVKVIKIPYNEAVTNFDEIEQQIIAFKPKMLTAVHCETPSGILNPIAEIGKLKHTNNVPLFYVDAVSSIAGAEVKIDDWHIDFCLGGGQKAPSIFPDMTFVSVSEKAWEIIDNVDYQGYDALKPFQFALQNLSFPYTPHWHGVASLNVCAKMLIREGMSKVFARHKLVADFCRKELLAMGLTLFPNDIRFSAPTVTAINVPENLSWTELDEKLRKKGVFFGGSYGQLSGKVFRIGHMGTQANKKLVREAIQRLRIVLRKV